MGSYGIQHHKEDSFHTVEYMFLTNWEHNIHIQIEDELSDPPINTYINMLLYSLPTPQSGMIIDKIFCSGLSLTKLTSSPA